ncbi:hypothetical protein I79_025011 [Cricetulus griseus]|uniref:Uncharacterized protein n=1 Tax=Cricetulus griseus TaxID=10029 RepID=G3IM79_CRIGR|nr:hypothetical protein I79_025011 [Cricetulus griseus]
MDTNHGSQYFSNQTTLGSLLSALPTWHPKKLCPFILRMRPNPPIPSLNTCSEMSQCSR